MGRSVGPRVGFVVGKGLGLFVGSYVGWRVGRLVVGGDVVGDEVGSGETVGARVEVAKEKKRTSPRAIDTATKASNKNPSRVQRKQAMLSAARAQHGASGPRETQQHQLVPQFIVMLLVAKDTGVSPLNSEDSSTLVRSVTMVRLYPVVVRLGS